MATCCTGHIPPLRCPYPCILHHKASQYRPFSALRLPPGLETIEFCNNRRRDAICEEHHANQRRGDFACGLTGRAPALPPHPPGKPYFSCFPGVYFFYRDSFFFKGFSRAYVGRDHHTRLSSAFLHRPAALSSPRNGPTHRGQEVQ